MFIPSVEKARYKSLLEPCSREVIQAGKDSALLAAAAFPSSSLPRYFVGDFSEVMVSGDPEIATVSLGDFANVTVTSPGKVNKDFVTVIGNDCCRIFIGNNLPTPENINAPLFNRFDTHPARPEDNNYSFATGFRVVGDSFTASFNESYRYGNVELEILLFPHRGDLQFYMKDHLVFTLKEGLRFHIGHYTGAWRGSLTPEEYLYKQLKKRYYELCRSQKKMSQSYKSVAA